MVSFWDHKALLGAALFIPLAAAGAQDTSQLSSGEILRCEAKCTHWTPPEPDYAHLKVWTPESDWHDAFDVLAVVQMTITAKGEVKDPVLLRLIGPAEYGPAVLEAIVDRHYTPATADGVPTETRYYNFVWQYAVNRTYKDASAEIRTIYEQASGLVQQNKFAEADALLLPVLARPKLLFHERAIISLALANSYSKQKDYVTAREYAVNASDLDVYSSNSLISGYDIRELVVRRLIQLDAVTGHLGDALDSYERLKRYAPLAVDDHETKVIETVNARLAAPAPIRVLGRIPRADAATINWTHILLRRHFAIPVIEGKLDQMSVSCGQKKYVSSISAKAEWHIPNNWSNCHVLVTGEPGTNFQFIESNE